MKDEAFDDIERAQGWRKRQILSKDKDMIQVEAMKLALEALELHGQQYPHMVKGYCLDAITALRQAIEQAQKQEPVAWGVDWGKAGDIPCVSIIKRLHDGSIEVMACEYAPYSYTFPPQRQPLTREQIERCQEEASSEWCGVEELFVLYARAIEAAHGITGEHK